MLVFYNKMFLKSITAGGENQRFFKHYITPLVPSRGIEPRLQVPETCVLSVERRGLS